MGGCCSSNVPDNANEIFTPEMFQKYVTLQDDFQQAEKQLVSLTDEIIKLTEHVIILKKLAEEKLEIEKKKLEENANDNDNDNDVEISQELIRLSELQIVSPNQLFITNQSQKQEITSQLEQ